MPHYQAWGATAQHQLRLPPTPPDYQSSYLTPMGAVSDQGYYGYHGRHSSSRDHSERYHQMPAYAAQQSITGHAQPRMSHSDYGVQTFSSLPAYQYAPTAAPILPPIRVADPTYPGHYPAQQEMKHKDEKPTGGVAQHLDYEMDVMAAFVAEMAQNLVHPNADPTTQFRKYVSQILSSTRLPSSTIMLGLFYLSKRMKIVTRRGEDTSSSGTVYRMLTTCLLLGSKFLDDNTFQNKSWAEVSSIPVRELNKAELDWLEGFDWEIHRLMHDEDDGIFVWIGHWHTYVKKAKVAKAAKEMHKLAPIETNLRRSYSVQHPALMSPEGPIPPQYQQGPQFDTRWARPYMSEYSPPSAPHSGPATPEYYPNQWSYAPGYGRQAWNNNTSAYQQSSFQHNPNYQPYAYPPSTWIGHGPGCACALCSKHSEYYFSHGGYGVQPVVG